ncbi:MAG: hypothetical protein Q3995_06960 [Eubacteriales bacterium]|nr:hypothetical protein [Eubacteriales bacterium]
MTAIQQVRTAVVNAIGSAGVTAITAYSMEELKKYASAVAAVGTREVSITRCGTSEYLGQRYDAVRGTVREVYGRSMELSLSLDIFVSRAVGANACEETAETVTQVMMTALPCGLRTQELRWEQVQWDKTYGMFRLAGTAKYEAYFTAESAGDPTEFTDFILRGVVQNHD